MEISLERFPHYAGPYPKPHFAIGLVMQGDAYARVRLPDRVHFHFFPLFICVRRNDTRNKKGPRLRRDPAKVIFIGAEVAQDLASQPLRLLFQLGPSSLRAFPLPSSLGLSE